MHLAGAVTRFKLKIQNWDENEKKIKMIIYC